MSPTVNRTHALPESSDGDFEFDVDEFEDLLQPVEDCPAADYKILLKEENLKTDVLRKVVFILFNPILPNDVESIIQYYQSGSVFLRYS